MKKVFIGVGHGGNDPGAIGIVTEKVVNLEIALSCRNYLAEHGVDVKLSREKDENDPLTEEIKECNNYKPDLCIDIHNNAGGGDGFEVYYHYLGGKSKELAQNIEKEILGIGQNSRGCKVKLNSTGVDYYGFIRQTNAPAVIVEGFFVDNPEDAKIGDTILKQRKLGMAYARGILKTLGVPENVNGAVYKVQVGCFNNYGNAKVLLDDLIKKGYKDAFIQEIK